jgi:hypothetical protein
VWTARDYLDPLNVLCQKLAYLLKYPMERTNGFVMKVDFLGPTKVLQQLLGTPTLEHKARPQGTPEFGRLLEGLDPNASKKLEKHVIEGRADRASSTALQPDPDIMGRYSFESPELITPDLQPENLPSIDSGEVEGSVKTPTVLSVKRVKSSELEELAVAPREERENHVRAMVSDAGIKHGVDPVLGLAVVSAESGFDPKALSSDGHYSKGLFQLLDSTANTIIEREGVGEVYSPYEPRQNVDLGVRYLRYLHDLFTKPTDLPNGMQTYPTANSSSLEKLAVAAFNAGEGRVAASQSAALRAGKDPSVYEEISMYLPESTQKYVERVLASKGEFAGS